MQIGHGKMKNLNQIQIQIHNKVFIEQQVLHYLIAYTVSWVTIDELYINNSMSYVSKNLRMFFIDLS